MKNIFRYLKISLFSLPIMATVQQEKPVRVIFFGDSITQAGVRPNGYITKMSEMLKAQNKSDQYELIGAGIGGNKIYDLYLRIEEDVLAKAPQVVFVYVGVNDVWHKRSHGTGTDADKFVRFYEAVIKKLKGAGARVILCTPAAIGEKTDHSNEQDGDLNKYSQLIRDLAKKNSIELVDLRRAFLDYNLKNNPENKEQGILTTDRVHLNDIGNQFVAEAMMSVLLAK